MDANQDNFFFISVMDLSEAKTHQIRLKDLGALVELRTNPSTCVSGCKVTVEVWGRINDQIKLMDYFKNDYLKNLKGHLPNFEHLNEIYDTSLSHVTCQACGHQFSTDLKSCPDCGLVYFS